MSKLDLWKAATMWNKGYDTKSIARELCVIEAFIYNRMETIRQQAKKV